MKPQSTDDAFDHLIVRVEGHGVAVAPDDGFAQAGDYGTAVAGSCGCVMAGFRGVLVLTAWHFGERIRIVAEVGKLGIAPNTPYRTTHGALCRGLNPAAERARGRQ